jgi:hypothetical protein
MCRNHACMVGAGAGLGAGSSWSGKCHSSYIATSALMQLGEGLMITGAQASAYPPLCALNRAKSPSPIQSIVPYADVCTSYCAL